MIMAIETLYDGCRFRSRLEARWAVFFNKAGIKYEYEKEGYDLDGVWYLPDFWLPEQKCFVEIKGEWPKVTGLLTGNDEVMEKALALTAASKNSVYIFTGSDFEASIIYRDRDGMYAIGCYPCEDALRCFGAKWKATYSAPYVFAQCPKCERIHIRHCFIDAPFCCLEEKVCLDEIDFHYSPRLIEAYAAARQARFEYGEKG